MTKRKKNRNGRAAVEARKRKLHGDSIKYKCLECGIEENIPKSAIEIIDIFDEGEGEPEFKCKECNGIMQPVENEKYEIEHKITGKCELDDEGDWLF